jgi:serine/threonine-protein kinase
MTDEARSLQAEVEPGTQLGEYRIERKLGEGGFGAVYRAVHPLIGKAAAVKVLHRQYSSNPEMVSRFVAEAKAVNQIRQRNIIDIFSFGQLPDGRQYYIMELLEGTSFDAYLDQHRTMEPAALLPILRQLAKALDAAHAAGIAHRDLKPENVFLVIDSDGAIFPKLLDFGIAKLLHDDNEQGGSIKTRTGTPMGTPYYMSPEQCRGVQVDQRTDIYSFGVMTFKALTGQLPFNADVVFDLLFKHLTEPPPRPSSVNPRLPATFDEPILKMLQKDPQQRPQTLTAAVDGLLQAAVDAGLPVSIPGVTLPLPTVSGPMPETASTRTLSTPNAGPLPLEPGSPPKGSPLVLGGLAVVLLGVVIFLLRPTEASTASGASSPASAAPSTPPALTSAPAPVASPPPLASVIPTEAPSTIELTLLKAPPSTAVYLGDLKLGVAPGPLQFKRGESPLKLLLKSPGYSPYPLEFTPTASGSVEVKMTRPAQTKKNPGDLENPFLSARASIQY